MNDDELVAAFEAGTLAALAHRDHVRLAFCYLRDLGDGVVQFRRALEAYACRVGAAGKYDETVTWAYLALVAARMHGGASSATSEDFVAANPELLVLRVMRRA